MIATEVLQNKSATQNDATNVKSSTILPSVDSTQTVNNEVIATKSSVTLQSSLTDDNKQEHIVDATKPSNLTTTATTKQCDDGNTNSNTVYIRNKPIDSSKSKFATTSESKHIEQKNVGDSIVSEFAGDASLTRYGINK